MDTSDITQYSQNQHLVVNFNHSIVPRKKTKHVERCISTIFGIRSAKYLKMTDILNIEDEPIFDDRIVKIETHTYNSFANTTFGYSEIRIPIQQQDLYTLPHESFLYIKGKLTINKPVAESDVALVNNCVAFMFNKIRYEFDGVKIDRNRNVGNNQQAQELCNHVI